jgi:hypothetical protein
LQWPERDRNAAPRFGLSPRLRQFRAAHRINQGGMPDWARIPESDFRFAPCRDAEDAAAKITEFVCSPGSCAGSSD